MRKNRLKVPDTIYISGPISDPVTGKPRVGAQTGFDDAECYLYELGLEVINPFALAAELMAQRSAAFNEIPRGEYLFYDLKRMRESYLSGHLAGLYMLPGWENSFGAQCEFHFAKSLGLPTFHSGYRGIQQTSDGTPFNPYGFLVRDIVKWYNIDELAAVVRNDEEMFQQYPDLKLLQTVLAEQRKDRIKGPAGGHSKPCRV